MFSGRETWVDVNREWFVGIGDRCVVTGLTVAVCGEGGEALHHTSGC